MITFMSAMTSGMRLYKRDVEDCPPPAYDADINERSYAAHRDLYHLHLLYEDDRFTAHDEQDDPGLDLGSRTQEFWEALEEDTNHC